MKRQEKVMVTEYRISSYLECNYFLNNIMVVLFMYVDFTVKSIW
jgi:hypothetical protein